MAIPETRYARTTDGTHVAYQINGDGPIDIVVLRAWHSNLDQDWEDPVLTGVHRRLGADGRPGRVLAATPALRSGGLGATPRLRRVARRHVGYRGGPCVDRTRGAE